jgi:hypothetical protein
MGRWGNLGGVRQDKVEAIILSASLYSWRLYNTARAGGHTHTYTECGGHSAQQKRRLYCPNSSLARSSLSTYYTSCSFSAFPPTTVAHHQE